MVEVFPTLFLIDSDSSSFPLPNHEIFSSVTTRLGANFRDLRLESFSNAAGFLHQLHPETLGCVVCDVRLPDMHGLELLEAIRGVNTTLPVLLMTESDFAEVRLVARLLSQGGVQFLAKPVEPQELIRRLAEVLIADRVRRERFARWEEFDRRLSELTVKERESLNLILEGIPNKAMAAREQITERAVEMRRASIMRKLQVHSLAELIRRVTEHHMLAKLMTPPSNAGARMW